MHTLWSWESTYSNFIRMWFCAEMCHDSQLVCLSVLFCIYGRDVNLIYHCLFLARDSICWARYAIARPSVRSSVCPFVRPSHGWISLKRLKLGSCNFHHTVAPSLRFLRYKFYPEISTGSPWTGASNNGGLRETSYCRCSNAFARWLPKLDILSQLLQTYSPGGRTVAR